MADRDRLSRQWAERIAKSSRPVDEAKAIRDSWEYRGLGREEQEAIRGLVIDALKSTSNTDTLKLIEAISEALKS